MTPDNQPGGITTKSVEKVAPFITVSKNSVSNSTAHQNVCEITKQVRPDNNQLAGLLT